MDLEKEILAMKEQISGLQSENDTQFRLLMAISGMIDVLTDRADKIEQSTSAEFKYIKGILDILSNEVYRMYYKVTPGALEVDTWLAQIARDASRKPPPRNL